MLKKIAKAVLPESVVRKIKARRLLAHLATREGHEPELDCIASLVDRTQVALDIGANIGVYSHVMTKYARRVLAFEPNPGLIQPLRDGTGAEIHQIALSSSGGAVTLKVPDGHLHPLSTLQDLDIPHHDVSVRTATLDSFCQAEKIGDIGLIKIDVEGHELEVLKGAVHTIEKFRPNIIVEAEDRHRAGAVQSVTAFMESLGYTGSFLLNGEEQPIGSFTDALQSPANITPLGGKSGVYVNNFIWRPSADGR